MDVAWLREKEKKRYLMLAPTSARALRSLQQRFFLETKPSAEAEGAGLAG
jgi:hypothetical protein